MTKRINSKFSVCKRIHGLYKNLWGVEKATTFRSIKLFKQNIYLVKQKKNRLTCFGRYLNTKQIIKNFYCNISEKNFQNYVKQSLFSKTIVLSKFFSLLESRIDNVLYKACFVNSLHMSRQLINHKLIFLNNQQIKKTGVLASKGDIIHLNPKKTYLHNKLIKILKQRRLKQYYLASIKIINKFSVFDIKHTIKSLNSNNRLFTESIRKIFIKKFTVFVKLKGLKQIELIPNYLEVNFQVFKIMFLWDPTYQNVYYPLAIQHQKLSKGKSLNLNQILSKK